jgi:hypothetical protein
MLFLKLAELFLMLVYCIYIGSVAGDAVSVAACSEQCCFLIEAGEKRMKGRCRL